MRTRDYFRLLKENRFRIHPAKYPMTVLVGGCAVASSCLSALQQVVYGKRIREVKLEHPPIFVIGHWRSGTTLMHELLALDQRHAYPSNFEAFLPSHFLVSRYALYPLVKMVMPGRRPMDNMSMSVDSPQEDDFALCALGAPTPYRRIAFPNQPSREHHALDLEKANSATQDSLRQVMEFFVKSLTVRFNSRLVLKSPPHTGRIRQLLEWFPGAKFVHMSRHPYKLVPSTMRLWKLLDSLQGFQIPKYDDAQLKNYIFECKDLMYSGYFSGRDEVPAEQLIEIRFEDLIGDPLQQMKAVYEKLELGSFEQTQPAIESYFSSRKNHKTNQHSLEPALKAEIDSHWQAYMKAFDYLST